MPWSTLKNSKTRFPLISIEKAANKIVIIYKCYYKEVILKEVRITGEDNKTYTPDQRLGNIDKNVEYSKKLGLMLWIPTTQESLGDRVRSLTLQIDISCL